MVSNALTFSCTLISVHCFPGSASPQALQNSVFPPLLTGAKALLHPCRHASILVVTTPLSGRDESCRVPTGRLNCTRPLILLASLRSKVRSTICFDCYTVKAGDSTACFLQNVPEVWVLLVCQVHESQPIPLLLIHGVRFPPLILSPKYDIQSSGSRDGDAITARSWSAQVTTRWRPLRGENRELTI